MNIRQLLGPNVNSDFVNAAAPRCVLEQDHARGYADYPSFDLAFQYSADYNQGYIDAYNDDKDALEQRRLTDERYPRSAEIDRKHGF